MEDHNEAIQQFIGVTGVTADRATFYLESATWNLELAMASFYDGETDETVDTVNIDDEEEDPAAPGSGDIRETAPSSRFATIGSMSQQGADDERQAFYAGGSETSGQQVLGPPRKKVGSNKVVDNLFQSAKDRGAEVVDETQPRKKGRSNFVGTGYRLGETEEESSAVTGDASAVEPRQVDMVLKMWKDGFSIDDGPIRDYQDPVNKEFLESIKNGEVPRELIRKSRGTEVNLNMEDHRNEEFVRAKVSMKAFSGEGNMLGSPAPDIISRPATNADPPAQTTSIDKSQPVTSIQIRLTDGTRLVGKFNHSHKVGDIRSFIASSRPQYASSNFLLQTTFPNKELTDDTETLESAKLLNAVIVQRLK